MATELATRLHHDPLVVLNKVDLVAPLPSSSVVATCALSGAGLPALLAAIAGRLVPEIPEPGSAVPFTERHAKVLTAALSQLDVGDVAGAASALQAMLG
jgi:hypothetical protein